MAERFPVIKEGNVIKRKDASYLRNLALMFTCLYFSTIFF